MTLLIVLAVVVGLYVKQAVAYFSVRGQADQEKATTLQLARQNHRLVQEQQMLGDPAAIQREARALGMVRQGERPYVITGAAAR